jgi:hypothetical protein
MEASEKDCQAGRLPSEEPEIPLVFLRRRNTVEEAAATGDSAKFAMPGKAITTIAVYFQ